MKIVVTGGLGFIGTNFARYMRRHAPQTELIAIDWRTERDATTRALFDHTHIGDFSAPQSAALYTQADVVVHLAATTTVQESVQDPYRSFENNVIKTQALLDILRLRAPECHVVFASTGGGIIGTHDGPIHEAVPPRPVSPYGATKLAVEGLLSAYSGTFGLRAAALRFSNVYGPGSAHKGSVVAAFCKACLDTRRLTINGDGTQTRDYVYVADICQAIFQTIQTRATGPFQLGTGRATSLLDLVACFRRLAPDAALEVCHGPALSGEVKHAVSDISHARQVLGYRPAYTLDRGLRATLDWFRRTPSDAASRAPADRRETAA